MKLHTRLFIARLSEKSMILLVFGLMCFMIFLISLLISKSFPLLTEKSIWNILFSIKWNPLKGEFGLLGFILGTLIVSGISILIYAPVCVLTAIFMSEYMPEWISRLFSSIIDILAGLPSVIYGIWGVYTIVPFFSLYANKVLNIQSSGYCVLSGSIVVGLMITPIIIQLSFEIFRGIPNGLKESSLCLGATKWETIKYICLKKSFSGLWAVIVLALSRALGETMAVMMVVGNQIRLPWNIFQPAYPLSALIANTYGEMMSVPLYDSAIMLAALVLFVIVLLSNLIGRLIINEKTYY